MSSAGDTAMTRISEGLNSAAVIFARLFDMTLLISLISRLTGALPHAMKYKKKK